MYHHQQHKQINGRSISRKAYVVLLLMASVVLLLSIKVISGEQTCYLGRSSIKTIDNHPNENVKHSSLLENNIVCECREGYFGSFCEHTNCTLLENCSINIHSNNVDDYLLLHLDNSNLYVENSKSIVHSVSITQKDDDNGEIFVKSPKIISSYLNWKDDILYQLEETHGRSLVITRYALVGNLKSTLNIHVTPSSIHSKFVNLFYSILREKIYLVEFDSEENQIGLVSFSPKDKTITNHGSLPIKGEGSDISCIFKQSRNSIECSVKEGEKLKIVEISILQNSFTIERQFYLDPPVESYKQVTLFNGQGDDTRIALTTKGGIILFYNILDHSWIEIGKTSAIEIVEHYETLEDSFLIGYDRMVIIPKTERFLSSQRERKINHHVLRRFTPKIHSIESKEFNPQLSSINIRMKGKDLLGHMVGVSYSSACAPENQYARFNPSCEEGQHCVSFNYRHYENCLNEEEKVSLKFLSKTSNRHVRSKFLNQFQSMNDVYSSMMLSGTNIPLTSTSPILSIVSNTQGSFLKSVSKFNTTTANDRRSIMSFEDNIISDVTVFADFILDETSMGNSFELWLMSTDGKYYLEAQVSQFGAGKPARIQIYPNLPGDAMTSTRKSDLETDRKICNDVKFNTMYRLIIQLTNPTFSEVTGLPMWTYHASIVEPTTAELEICSLIVDSTMKKANYETIQDTKFGVGVSQSAYSKLFSSIVTSLNVTATIKAVGLRCQSADCNQIYIVPSLNDIIIISATLGSSLLFVLIVICLIISIIVCIIRPWHIELTEEQKKEMELKRNFERLQQLQRTMSLGHAHSPVRSIASSNRYQQRQSNTETTRR